MKSARGGVDGHAGSLRSRGFRAGSGPRRTAALAPISAAVALSTAGVLPVLLVGAEATFEERSLNLSSEYIALIIAGFFLSAATSSWLSRVIHARPDLVMRAGSTLMVTSCLIVLLMGTRLALVGALILAGVAYGGTQPAVSSYLGMHVHNRSQGVAFGLRQTAVPIATVTAGLTVAVVSNESWRYAYLMPAILVLAAFTFMSANPIPSVTGGARRGRAVTPASRGLALVAMATGLGGAAAYILSALCIPYCISRGFGAREAGTLAAVGGIAALLARLGMGVGSDRHAFSKLRAAGFMLLLGGISFGGVAFGGSIVLAVAVVAAFATGSGWNGLALHSLVESFPDSATRATGTALTAVYIGAAVGPPLFELIAGRSGGDVAWACVMALTLTAGMLMLVAARSGGMQALPSRGV